MPTDPDPDARRPRRRRARRHPAAGTPTPTPEPTTPTADADGAAADAAPHRARPSRDAAARSSRTAPPSTRPGATPTRPTGHRPRAPGPLTRRHAAGNPLGRAARWTAYWQRPGRRLGGGRVTTEQRGSEPPQGGDRFRHWSVGHGEAGRGRTVISLTIRANQQVPIPSAPTSPSPPEAGLEVRWPEFDLDSVTSVI